MNTQIDQPQSYISVIICSFNPNRNYFAKTLESLRLQSLPTKDWELIIVDNNSIIPIKELCTVDWHPGVQWLHEANQGKIFALMTGIMACKGDLIITIDDDCQPDSDYLKMAREIMHKNPELGAFGAGTITPLFESTPPSWFLDSPLALGLLAIRNIKIEDISGSSKHGQRPWGLGLCITPNVAAEWMNWCDQHLDKLLHKKGRKATVLEDDLFSFCAVKNGLKFGVFPSLGISHIIPAFRLSVDYLAAHAYDHGYSGGQFALAQNLPCIRPDPPVTFGSLLMPFLGLSRSKFLYTLKSMRQQINEPSPVHQLRVSRVEGWKQAVCDYQSCSYGALQDGN